MNELFQKMFETATKVANEWSLAAFAMALLVLIVFLVVSRQKRMPKGTERILGGVIVALVVLAAMPLIGRNYLEKRGIYRLRVVVEGPDGMPSNDARLTSSIGGEPKRVEGGWEFDIPTETKPKDGKVIIYGEVGSAFLTGKTDVALTNDYNLVTRVHLDRDRSAHIRGRVVDRNQNPIPGVLVSVVGYESEAKTTGTLGQFDLLAHAADGQQVQVAAFKKKLGSVSEWKQAGEQPATVVLGK